MATKTKRKPRPNAIDREREAEALVIWWARMTELLSLLSDAVGKLREGKNTSGTVAAEVFKSCRLGEVEDDLSTAWSSFCSASPVLAPVGFVPPPGVPS